MFHLNASILLFLSCASAVAATDPGAALATARMDIEAGRYSRAIAILRASIPDAAAIIDPKQHDEALAALHFYTAVALSSNGSSDEARDELRQFARYRPGTTKIDKNKYPAAFVKMFNDIVAQPAIEAPQSFDRFYPGFGSVRAATPKAVSLSSWGASAEVQILATSEEKSEWERLPDDDARREFVANFWVSRDPDPATPLNEWREEFNRRVVFADEAFGGGTLRGSMTDRGHVFVLLGPPSRVHVRNIARRQGGFLTVNGTEERWVYFKPQLPDSVRQNEIDFRFIDQPAYGDHVLEKDFLPMHALAEARKAFIAPR